MNKIERYSHIAELAKRVPPRMTITIPADIRMANANETSEVRMANDDESVMDEGSNIEVVSPGISRIFGTQERFHRVIEDGILSRTERRQLAAEIAAARAKNVTPFPTTSSAFWLALPMKPLSMAIA